jgi:hypothetical protein
MPKSATGLYILNPYATKIVEDGFAHVRIQMEIVGFFDEEDLHGNTPNVIRSFRDHFTSVMATQMENGNGIIYDAITGSQELYCNFK